MYKKSIAFKCKLNYDALIKLLVMFKVSLLLIMLTVSQAGAEVFAQKASIKANKMTLKEVFIELRKQTGYHFLYLTEDLRHANPVTLDLQQTDLDEILKQCFANQPLTYEIRRNRVLVSLKEIPSAQSSMQEYVVKGRVTDDKGSPLEGVTVALKGTQRVTTTNAAGQYQLNLPKENGTIVFSIIGFTTEERSASSGGVVDVTLKESVANMDEVVVVGYGTVRKGDLTGSVTSVKSEDITALPSINAMQSLTGRSAGVQVIQGSGAPGSGISVRIRGGNSLLASNEPLYVVDGFAISGSPTILDPADIESMEVLKDASATAIYGSRGANGVVMITTKSGKKDASQVSFNSYLGFQNVVKKLDMLNAQEFAGIANERARNDGVAPYFTEEEVSSFGEGTDWQDAIFRTAPIQNHSLSIGGGNDKTRYSVSGSYFGQEGIVINSGYKRASIRSNLEQKVSEKFKVNLSTILSRTISDALTNDNQSRGSGVVSAALVAPPTVPVYDENGNYSNVVPYSFSSNAAENPVALAYERLNRTTGNGVLSNLALSYTFIEGLTLRVSAGIDYANSKADYYSSRLIRSTPAGNAATTYYTRTNFLNENILNYNKTFGIHQLDLTGGITYQSEIVHNNSQSASGFTTDVLKNNNLQAATVIGTPTASVSEWTLLSGLFRANYTLQNKYLFTASIRADGSSRFGTTNQWGYFPSTAFAWRINQEDFLKEVEAISNLKFRASWGQSGNTAINPYGSLNVLSGFNIILGDNLYTGFAPLNQRPNPDLKWETTTQTNLGFDLGLLNERIRFTFDFYNKNTNDLLASVPQPTSTGYTSQFQNIGKIRNRGVEFELGADLFRGDFKWDASLNFSANRNKVLELANNADVFGQALLIPLSVSPNLVRPGYPVGVFFGFQEDGLNEQGRIQYKDLDGNGVINNLDRTIIGNPNPDFIFGFNNNFSYKNFTLNVFFQGTQGLDIFNFNLSNHANAFNFGENQVRSSLDRWTPENPNTNAPNPVVSVGSSFRESDRFIEDGSFIRLKNIRLGYNFPVNKLSFIKALQVYASAQNLWTSTNYSWYDPEVSTRTNQSATTIGIDQTSYPVAKTYTFGLQASF